MTSVRSRVSGWIPGAGDFAFNRDRSLALPESRAPRRGYRPIPRRDRTAHLVIVPIEGPQFPDWQPGTRNFYYEAFQSARERLGDARVSVLDVAPGESPDIWIHRLQDLVNDVDATHILTHLEHDPGAPHSWHWDVAWNRIAPMWDGVLLGVMFDSAFDLVTMKARRLARMSPNFVAVDICMPMDGLLVRRRSEVGPVTMPVSQQSLQLLGQRLSGVALEHDVSFIGALYPYRLQLIEQLRAHGVDVVVNPHRSDVTHDFASSRSNQPGWLDYMAGLAASRMTINFSRSSAGDFEQLKTRVIEATLAGTLLLTDDRYRTQMYFTPDVEFGRFESLEHLPKVIDRWLTDETGRLAGARSAQAKAEGIASMDFWHRIDAGLVGRGLPTTGVSSR